MTIEAELPDGRILEFPEGTAPEVVQSTVRRVLRVAPQKPFVPSGEKEVPSLTDPAMIAANPFMRFAKGAAAPILGAVQLSANLQDPMYRALGVPMQPGKAMNERLAQLESLTQEGRNAVGSEGIDVPELAGNVLSPAALAATKIPAAATLPGRMRQGASIGAAFGAATPVTNGGENFAADKAAQIGGGAVVGGLVPAATSAIAATGKAAYHAVEPLFDTAAIKGRAFLEAAGDKADEILNLLRQNKELVPGSAPTAAEAAAPAGRAEFSALQEAARQVNPTPYVQRADEQNAARLSSLRTVAGDKSALATAEATRSANAAANYGAVAGDRVSLADKDIQSLLRRPSMQKALDRAGEIAAEQGVSLPTKGVKLKEITVGGLQTVKSALDDMIKNPEQFGIGASEAKAIGETRAQFVQWLNKNSPGWESARLQYAAESAPINQMKVGQFLENKLTPALSEEAPQRAATFANAVREAPTTLKRATGQPRYDSLSEVLTPDQLKVVEGVQADLARIARHGALAKAGSEAINGSMEPPQRLPNMLNRGVMVANAILTRLEGKMNRKLAAEVAAEMLNPPRVAESMRAAQLRQATNEIMARQISAATKSATYGAIQGAEKK